MQPKVSFITAVKDRPEELKEMLRSLINQDIPEWEAIIVDDHGQKNLKDAVLNFNESRFHYYPLIETSGVSAARNFAITHTNSDILLIADGDDINKPARARVTWEEMNKNKCDVFYSRIEYFFENETKRTKQFFQPFNIQLFQMVNFINNPGAAFKKEIFLKAGQYDSNFDLSEDYDLWLRMLKNNAKFCYTDKVLVEYRRSLKSASVSRHKEMHNYIMKTRIKNDIKPFNIRDVKKYAINELAESILENIDIWRDDRFKENE